MGLGNNNRTPNVPATPPPAPQETRETVKEREEKRRKSLIRAMEAQNRLGAAQLRGDSTGVRIE